MNTETSIMVKCPHCGLYIQILEKEFNCKIFRHGIYKKTFRQIDPHLPKILCDALKERRSDLWMWKTIRITINQ